MVVVILAGPRGIIQPIDHLLDLPCLRLADFPHKAMGLELGEDCVHRGIDQIDRADGGPRDLQASARWDRRSSRNTDSTIVESSRLSRYDDPGRAVQTVTVPVQLIVRGSGELPPPR
jgi:hypothetical protein